jgi:hypothetical protein
MPAKSRKQPGRGTLIRGADGALYFVFDGEEWAYRLPNEKTADARALLDQQDFVAKQDRLPGIHGSGLVHRIGDTHEVEIVLNRLAALIKQTRHAK